MVIAEPGMAVIMDNAGFHRKKQVKEICEKAGTDLLFPPPYSPGLNPIEKDWANMKHELQNTMPLEGLLKTAVYNYWIWVLFSDSLYPGFTCVFPSAHPALAKAITQCVSRTRQI